MLLELEKNANQTATGESAVNHPACRIIGVLDNGAAGLSETALTHIQQADLIIGSEKMLHLMQPFFKTSALRRDLSGQLTKVPDWIRDAQSKQQRCVVLASGDPLCHGIGGYLQSRLCIEACEIIPNVSTVQLACARLGVTWQDIKICSVHKSDVGEWDADLGMRHGLYSLLHSLQHHDRIAVLTSPDNTPDRIARMMMAEGLENEFQIAVVERLLSADEKVRGHFSVEQASSLRFADPNVVIMWRVKPSQTQPLFGLSDDSYQQRKPEKGLITKREIRAISLARMQLRRDAIVWDIGAGSGSVGLEAARLAQDGYVYAMEKNQLDYEIAGENKRAMGVHNYSVFHAKAPNGLEQWPDPDAVFIGGSGGELAELVMLCFQRLNSGGHLVMNFVTLENLQVAMECVKTLQSMLGEDVALEWDLCQLQVSRSKPILNMQRLAAENPVWILSLQKVAATPHHHGERNNDDQ